MGDWAKNLTKTPYLVLFVVLISVSVGTASALITITLAGDVKVTGDMDVDGLVSAASSGADPVSYNRIGPGSTVTGFVSDSSDLFVSDDIEALDNAYLGNNLHVGQSSSLDSDFIYFDTALLEFIAWIESDGFRVSDSLLVDGDLDVSGNSITDDDSILFHSKILPESLKWDNSETSFAISDDLIVEDDLYVGTNDEGDVDLIRFDNGSETFGWDEFKGRFGMSDGLGVGDAFSAGGNFADVGYHRFGGGFSNHGLSGLNDVLVTEDLEVHGDLFVDTDVECGGCIHGTDIAPGTIESGDIKQGEVVKGLTLSGEASVTKGSASLPNSINLGSTNNRMCFFTQVSFNDHDLTGDVDEASCTIREDNGDWILTAGGGDDTVHCKARCLSWTD